jgi:GNAT superfamily N-acetyltransferase
VVAVGGILFHYNVPYGDIYMGVAEPFRRRGYGSYLVQELKRSCYEMGKVPAARCNASNAASRATLQKAGMLPCARVLTGVIAAAATDPARPTTSGDSVAPGGGPGG